MASLRPAMANLGIAPDGNERIAAFDLVGGTGGQLIFWVFGNSKGGGEGFQILYVRTAP